MPTEKHASKDKCNGRQSLSPAMRARLEKLYEHATAESLKPKDPVYVAEMLAQCVLGDPGNKEYISAYFENLSKKYGNNKKGCSLAKFKKLGARASLKKALDNKQWREVIKYGLEVLTVNPWDIPALTGMATATKRLGHLQSELFYLKTALIGSPRDPACNRLMAKALAERGRIDQAIDFWHRVEEVLPDNEEAEKAIGDLSLKKVVSREDLDVPAENDVVVKKIRFKAKQREEMARTEKIQQMIDEEPDNVDHYLDLAQILLNEERYGDAEDALRRAYENSEGDPDILERWDDVQLRHLRQRVMHTEDASEKKRLQQAFFAKDLEVCGRRVKRYPGNFRFRFELGFRFMMAKRYPEAIEQLQIAKKDSARTGVALLALGQCFQQLKQYPLAMSHYEAAIREIPDHDTYNRKQALHLGGRLAVVLNDIDTAETHLTALACLDFNYKDCKVLLEKISNLRELQGNAAPMKQS